MMFYKSLGLTIPDAVCVVGDFVTMYFNPTVPNQSIGLIASPWYTDDEGNAYEDVYDQMEMDGMTLSIPIEWADFTILPPMYHREPEE
jgi:hypothetical protein